MKRELHLPLRLNETRWPVSSEVRFNCSACARVSSTNRILVLLTLESSFKLMAAFSSFTWSGYLSRLQSFLQSYLANEEWRPINNDSLWTGLRWLLEQCIRDGGYKIFSQLLILRLRFYAYTGKYSVVLPNPGYLFDLNYTYIGR